MCRNTFTGHSPLFPASGNSTTDQRRLRVTMTGFAGAGCSSPRTFKSGSGGDVIARASQRIEESVRAPVRDLVEAAYKPINNALEVSAL
jgi:hypothetical protein